MIRLIMYEFVEDTETVVLNLRGLQMPRIRRVFSSLNIQVAGEVLETDVLFQAESVISGSYNEASL